MVHRLFSLPVILLSGLTIAGLPNQCAAEYSTEYSTTGSIERLDPALDQLIPKDAKIEILCGQFKWSEGPVWIKKGGYLLFSDVPTNTIYRWKEGEGKSVYLNPSGFTQPKNRPGEMGSNGLALDAQGRLVLCQHGDRRVARMESPLETPQPIFSTLASKDQGKRLNSPNDLVFHSNGNLYFTDPPYGLVGGTKNRKRELSYQGVYLVRTSGEVLLLTGQLERPNGIGLSPDERTLYVANSHGPRPIWMAYDVLDDGTLENGRTFFDSTAYRKQHPDRQGGNDGLKVDLKGNLFATGPGGVLIFSPDGKHLGTILTGVATANCGFGDDGQTLYMTANAHLMRVRLSTRGW